MNPLRHSLSVRVLIVLMSVILAACKPGAKPDTTVAETVIPQAAAADDFLILPGDYAEKTTVADLEARFGKANVRHETEPEPRVILFPDDPTRRAYAHFYESTKGLTRIDVNDPGSRWRGKHGVHVGMTLAKLRELNGKPFYYSGFDEQKRAIAHDAWSPSMGDDDATLGAFDVSAGDRLYFDVELGVGDASRVTKASDLPPDEQVSSDDKRFPHLGDIIVVTGFSASSSLDDEWE